MGAEPLNDREGERGRLKGNGKRGVVEAVEAESREGETW